jgi:hypothetical protein
VTDHTAPQEPDEKGNVNNFLAPEQIVKEEPATAAIMSTVTPESTTAALAKDVPLEKTEKTEKIEETPATSAVINSVAPESTTAALVKDVPLEKTEKTEGTEKIEETPATSAVINSVAPESTTAALAKDVPLEKTEKIEETPATSAVINSVVPESTTAALAKEVPLEMEKEAIPTPSDIPGGFPITPANELDKPIGINPMPAGVGLEGVKLAPGEKIPESLTKADINEHVTLDKESYEKSDTIAGIDTTLPPVTKDMIPESSLPITSPPLSILPIVETKEAVANTINTVTPQSTTAALAAAVPLEPKALVEPTVPEIVKESQVKAAVDPEASAEPEEVKEKAIVEDELLKKVPEVPATSEGTSGLGTTKTEGQTTIAALATTAVGTAVAAAIVAKETLVAKATPAITQASTVATDVAAKLPESVKDALPVSVKDAILPPAKEETRQEISPEVPAEVKSSIVESGKSPEAAVNTAAVEEKKEVEAELLEEVKPVPPVDEIVTTEAEAVNGGETAPKAVEEAKPVEEAPKVANGSETTETKTANGTETPAETTASSSTAVEKKKKNRLSAFLHKIKGKVSTKDK